MYVSRKFEGSLKFIGCFMKDSRMFQGSFKGVYKKFNRCLKFQECFKEVSGVFQLRLKGVSSYYKGHFKGI